MDEHRIAYLILQEIQGLITKEEKIELNEWIQSSTKNKEVYEKSIDEKSIFESIKDYGDIENEEINSALKRVKARISF